MGEKGLSSLPRKLLWMEPTPPLSRPIFIYVNRRSTDKLEVKEFVEFYLRQAPALVKQVKYIPLPNRAYMLATDRFSKRTAGTVFGGAPKIGLKVEDLLRSKISLC